MHRSAWFVERPCKLSSNWRGGLGRRLKGPLMGLYSDVLHVSAVAAVGGLVEKRDAWARRPRAHIEARGEAGS